VLGVLALVVAPLLLLLWLRWKTQDHRDDAKECPDCRETVRRVANVCRHCGYRWRPAGSRELRTSPYNALRSLPVPARALLRWSYERQSVRSQKVFVSAALSPKDVYLLEAALRRGHHQWPIAIYQEDDALVFRSKGLFFAADVDDAAREAWGDAEAKQRLLEWQDHEKINAGDLSHQERRDLRYWTEEHRYE